jgi:hypothetical protein
MNVDPDRPRHVVLYAVRKWHYHQYDGAEDLSQDCANAKLLREYVGPIGVYGYARVDRHLRELETIGYLSEHKVNGVKVGYEITTAGMKKLQALGVPSHFDH